MYSSTEMLRLVAAGRFENPAWFDRLMVRFANLYREALWADLNGARAQEPRAWQTAFTGSEDSDLSAPLQQVLSLNAHISRDLAFALLDSDTDFGSASEKRDYDAINEAFRSAIPHTWNVLGHFGRKFSRLERAGADQIAWVLILEKRAAAWSNAAKLSLLEPADRAEGLARIETGAERLAEEFLALKWIVR